jgi:hypothetical protein
VLEAMRSGPNLRPGTMNKPEPHPLELLLLALLVMLEALAVLAVAVLALLLTLASWKPAAAAPAAPPPPAPAVHPLAVVATTAAEALEPLTVAQLRRRARGAGLPRCLSRAGRRAALLEALAGLEVAACS